MPRIRNKDKNKRNEKFFASSNANKKYYTKFRKVQLVATGPIVLAKCTTIEDREEVYCWNSKENRDMIKDNSTKNVEIIIAPTVPKDRGWDYSA